MRLLRWCCPPAAPLPPFPVNNALNDFLAQEDRLTKLRKRERELQLQLCFTPTLPERLPIYSALLRIKADIDLCE